jgi:hypothetical protein
MLAGTSMVGIFFLLLRFLLLSFSFVIHIFRSEQTQRNLEDVYVFNGQGSSVRCIPVYRCTGSHDPDLLVS